MSPKTTDYHDWSYPEEGESGWDTIVNSWIENDVDEEVIKKDTKANRPAAGTTGRWFLATDEPNIYLDDGDTWIQITNQGDHSVSDNGSKIIDSIADLNFADHLSVSNPSTGVATVSLKVDSDLSIRGNNLVGWGSLRADDNTGTIFTAGTGSATVNIYDGNAGQYLLRAFESDGAIEMPNGPIRLGDISASPSGNGEFTLDTGDVEVMSGGAVRNLSNVGSGGSSGGAFGPGNYVEYVDGLTSEEINKIYFDDANESLSIDRVAAPVKGTAQGTTVSGVTLEVLNGDGSSLVLIDGNTFDATGWTATASPCRVQISNSTGSSQDVSPKIVGGFQ